MGLFVYNAQAWGVHSLESNSNWVLPNSTLTLKPSLAPFTNPTSNMLTRCPNIFRRLLRSSPSITARGGERLLSSLFYQHESLYSTHTETLTENDRNRKNGKWFILPPFAHTVNLSALGKELTGGGCESNSDADSKMTAVKWTLRCCPELPRSLVQKLFRLRQVCFNLTE